MARLAVVLDDAGLLAGRRRLVEAQDLDRRAGLRLLHLLAAIVVQRAHAAPGVAGDDRVAAERLRDGHHLPDVHHDLDDLRNGDAQRGGELLHRGARADLDRSGRLNGCGLLRAGLGRLARGARVLPRASGLGVDYDTPLALPRGSAASRSQWSLPVSHGSVLSSWGIPDGIVTFRRRVRAKARRAAARSKHAGRAQV